MDGYSLSVQYKLHSDCFLIAAGRGFFTWTPTSETWKIIRENTSRSYFGQVKTVYGS